MPFEIAVLVFILSAAGVILVFLLNPLLSLLAVLIKGKKTVKTSSIYPPVSLITVVHNAQNLILDKIKNSLSLDYPSERFEFVIFSDGSTDDTESKIKNLGNGEIRLLSNPVHEGKNSGINSAVQHCNGEIIVFSDAGAMIDKDGIKNLVKYFADPDIGGVCGELVIVKDKTRFSEAQSDYWRFDRTIRILESQAGSISSNTGTLYAIRRELFNPLPPAVTDDLYNCLSVVKQNYRFIFVPDAMSFTQARSIGPAHEVGRRRRIVNRSLRSICLMRELLNPFKFGIFSINLLNRNVIRRLLPVCLIMMFTSNLYLSFYSPWYKAMFLLQVAFYLSALFYGTLFQKASAFGGAARIAALAYYFCIGNYGTLLGLMDFITGKQFVKWTSVRINGK